MKAIISYLILINLTILCLPAYGAATGNTVIKTYHSDGRKIESGFIPDADKIVLGQPLFITFTVTNKSKELFSFKTGGDNRGSIRHNNFRITAVDSQGKAIQDPYSYNNFGGIMGFESVEKDQTYRERLFLGHWCHFMKPGVYTVSCKRTLQDAYHEDRKQRKEAIAISSSFKLEILPGDPQKMDTVIAEIGNKIKQGKEQYLYEASIALKHMVRNHLNDDYIPYLALILQKGDFQNKLPAIESLERYYSNKAADALIHALKDRDHAVRNAGSATLQKIEKGEYVFNKLLPHMQDEDPAVRTLTAQALGATKAKGAVKALIDASRDDNAEVRYTAAMALGASGHEEARKPLEGFVQSKDLKMCIASAKGLHKLGVALKPDWLTAIINKTIGANERPFHEAIRLLRMHCGKESAPALVSCLNFDDPTLDNSRNMYLILAAHHSKGGPQYYYKFHSDPNTEGTPKKIEENRIILTELKAWLEENQIQSKCYQ